MKCIVHTRHVHYSTRQNLFIYHWNRTHSLVYKFTVNEKYLVVHGQWIFIIGSEIHPVDLEEWHIIRKKYTYFLFQ